MKWRSPVWQFQNARAKFFTHSSLTVLVRQDDNAELQSTLLDMAAVLLKSLVFPSNNSTRNYTPLRPTGSVPSIVVERAASPDSGIAMSDSFVDEKITTSEIRPSPTRINPRLISDATIGLSDGLTVPFALTAGLSALGDTNVVIYGGLAELIAGGISMVSTAASAQPHRILGVDMVCYVGPRRLSRRQERSRSVSSRSQRNQSHRRPRLPDRCWSRPRSVQQVRFPRGRSHVDGR